jgi:hypothetical protein
MNRFWRNVRIAAALGIAGVASLPACAHDDSTIYVHGVLAPPATGAMNGQACPAFTPAPDQPFLAIGTVDVGLTNVYEAPVLIGNQLLATGNQIQVRAETNRVQIEGAVVRVTDPAGNEISSFTSLTSGLIDPAAGTSPSFLATFVTLLDPSTAIRIRDGKEPVVAHDPLTMRSQSKTVIVYFKMFGKTLGGEDVETAEYQWPLRVCRGCLVSFTPDATGAINCLAMPQTPVIPCILGQDQPLSCFFCFGAGNACDPKTM